MRTVSFCRHLYVRKDQTHPNCSDLSCTHSGKRLSRKSPQNLHRIARHSFLSSIYPSLASGNVGNAEVPIARISGGAPKAEESTRWERPAMIECWFSSLQSSNCRATARSGSQVTNEAMTSNMPPAHSPRSHFSKIRTYNLHLCHANRICPPLHMAICEYQTVHQTQEHHAFTPMYPPPPSSPLLRLPLVRHSETNRASLLRASCFLKQKMARNLVGWSKKTC